MVEPLSAFTFLAYLNTKIIAIKREVNQRANPKTIIKVLLYGTFTLWRADSAAPVAKGLIVEPSTPQPAPSKTVDTATMVSKPAATNAAVIKG